MMTLPYRPTASAVALGPSGAEHENRSGRMQPNVGRLGCTAAQPNPREKRVIRLQSAFSPAITLSAPKCSQPRRLRYGVASLAEAAFAVLN